MQRGKRLTAIRVMQSEMRASCRRDVGRSVSEFGGRFVTEVGGTFDAFEIY